MNTLRERCGQRPYSLPYLVTCSKRLLLLIILSITSSLLTNYRGAQRITDVLTGAGWPGDPMPNLPVDGNAPSLPTTRYRDAQLIIDVLTGEGVPTRLPAAARAAGACGWPGRVSAFGSGNGLFV